jgi:5-(carboxyamino)imidazole ribonucleotide synthase
MILPPAVLGLLGGGQLGHYFVRSARQMGYRVWVLDPDPHCPAGHCADRHLCADYTDADALAALAQAAAVVTCEFENVPAMAAQTLAQQVLLRPAARALAIAQDRVAEKRFLEQAGVAVVPWRSIPEAAALTAAREGFAFPAVLKTTRLGYDGKGQRRVATAAELPQAFAALGEVPCVLEQQMDLQREFSLLLACGPENQRVAFPLAENRHHRGILHLTRVPARVPPSLADQAHAWGRTIARELAYCGVLAVEYFLTTDGRLWVNEVAPRPHNSGHYTLDATSVSQFEQQVRAVCGLALAPVTLQAPVVMLNLLGDLWPQPEGLPDFSGVLADASAHLHLYGKNVARPGRKMGHVNWLGETADADPEALLGRAQWHWQRLARAASRSSQDDPSW